MKIVILSDIHGNLAALESLPERDFDQLWCLGDLVDYGPCPHQVIKWIQHYATITVRGNHDHAVGFSVDPHCSRPFRKLAAETLRYTQELCKGEDLRFLRSLPLHQEITVDSTSFYLVHATPSEPLFAYCQEHSDLWPKEVDCIDTELLIVGHTHTPFIRREGKTTILNPGSIGQPKTGRPFACYAVWEDGKISLKEYPYPVFETVQQIRKMPLSINDQDSLITVLETGHLPSCHHGSAAIMG